MRSKRVSPQKQKTSPSTLKFMAVAKVLYLLNYSYEFYDDFCLSRCVLPFLYLFIIGHDGGYFYMQSYHDLKKNFSLADF